MCTVGESLFREDVMVPIYLMKDNLLHAISKL